MFCNKLFALSDNWLFVLSILTVYSSHILEGRVSEVDKLVNSNAGKS